MNRQTELLLYHLAWTAEMMMMPSWRNLSSSFEGWAYRKGLLRQIQRLEAGDLLETRVERNSGERVIRLTKQGLRLASGPRRPEDRWARRWDGKWRLVMFDLPERDRPLRGRLRNRLREAGFGCLQRSIWVSPDPMGELRQNLRDMVVEAETLLVLEGKPCCGERAEDVVRSAWDFERIARNWRDLDRHLTRAPAISPPDREAARQAFIEWSRVEFGIWKRCLREDPLLPECLLPADYPARAVLKRRRQVMHLVLGEIMEIE